MTADEDTFPIHPRLAAETVHLSDWTLCRIFLMNDRRFPWLVLVPRVAGAVELFDLESAERAALAEEISRAGRLLKASSGADKINIGALGNIVPQLHIHVVARNRDDAAWPGPVWGHGQRLPYSEGEIVRITAQLRGFA